MTLTLGITLKKLNNIRLTLSSLKLRDKKGLETLVYSALNPECYLMG